MMKGDPLIVDEIMPATGPENAISSARNYAYSRANASIAVQESRGRRHDPISVEEIVPVTAPENVVTPARYGISDRAVAYISAIENTGGHATSTSANGAAAAEPTEPTADADGVNTKLRELEDTIIELLRCSLTLGIVRI
eukprot:IDg17281t1